MSPSRIFLVVRSFKDSAVRTLASLDLLRQPHLCDILLTADNYGTRGFVMAWLNRSRAKHLFLSLFIYGTSLFAVAGCAHLQAQPAFDVDQIYDVSRQQPITFAELLPHLLAADVIFIGEEHYTPSHLEAAQQILTALLAHHRHPALAMEMFSWDGQSALDRYIQLPESTTAQLVEDSQWKTNWGGEFKDYQSLVTFAKSHQLRILGLNPPRPLVRSVATAGINKGLTGSGNEEVADRRPRHRRSGV